MGNKVQWGDRGSVLNYVLDSTGSPVPLTGSASGSQSVTVATSTTGGTVAARVSAAATTNATSVKAAAGQIYGIELANNAAYAVFLKLFNKASAPTLGTDTPVRTIQIPAGGRCDISRPLGMAFSTGIAYAITKLLADNDTTAVAAGDLVGNIDYA